MSEDVNTLLAIAEIAGVFVGFAALLALVVAQGGWGLFRSWGWSITGALVSVGLAVAAFAWLGVCGARRDPRRAGAVVTLALLGVVSVLAWASSRRPAPTADTRSDAQITAALLAFRPSPEDQAILDEAEAWERREAKAQRRAEEALRQREVQADRELDREDEEARRVRRLAKLEEMASRYAS